MYILPGPGSNSIQDGLYAFGGVDAVTSFIGICLEGFLYGLYSGIFALYLKCSLSKSRNLKTTIVFYALCLLYVLSTVTVLSDLKQILCTGLQYAANPNLVILQTVASGLCDFVAQCIMIYRCWIVWDQNICVVIIPSFLAITYIATWLASDSLFIFRAASSNFTEIIEEYGAYVKWYEGTVGMYEMSGTPFPPNPMIITSFVLSMAVNTLMTGLIVLKIVTVFLEVKPTTGGTTFRPVIFIIIESGMALFAVQMVRVVLSCLPLNTSTLAAFNLMTGINEIFNGIAPTLILVRVSMRSSIDDNESFKEAVGSICFNIPPSDPSILQRDSEPVRSSSMQLQEIQSLGSKETRSEDIF